MIGSTLLYVLLMIAIGYSVSECSRLRYRVAAVSGYRQYGAIILYGALYVMAWTAAAYFVVVLIPTLYESVAEDGIGYMDIRESVYDFVTIRTTPILLTGLLSTLLFRYFANIYDRNEENQLVKEAIHDLGDELNILLVNSVEERRAILLVLDNGRFYLGWAVGTPNPLDDREHQYIRILPIRIGYRSKKQKDVSSVNYNGVFRTGTHRDIRSLEEIIPRKSIKSARIFKF